MSSQFPQLKASIFQVRDRSHTVFPVRDRKRYLGTPNPYRVRSIIVGKLLFWDCSHENFSINKAILGFAKSQNGLFSHTLLSSKDTNFIIFTYSEKEFFYKDFVGMQNQRRSLRGMLSIQRNRVLENQSRFLIDIYNRFHFIQALTLVCG